MPTPHEQLTGSRIVTKARRARFELATGELVSFERLSDEVVPLDQIRWRNALIPDGHIETGALRPQPTNHFAKPKARSNTIPQEASPSAKPRTVHYSVSQGVSVLVRHDGRSPLSLVRALEEALVQARRLLATVPKVEPLRSRVAAVSKKAVVKPVANPIPSKGGTKPVPPSVGFAPLRLELGSIARSLVERGALPATWKTKGIQSWLRHINEATSPAKVASLMYGLEAEVCDKGKVSPSWLSRRKTWVKECLVVTTFEDVERLFVEFRDTLSER